jgi:hypothetical protein
MLKEFIPDTNMELIPDKIDKIKFYRYEFFS